MSNSSALCLFAEYPDEPIQMFRKIIGPLGENPLVIMNLTKGDNPRQLEINTKLGAVNRLLFRDIVKDNLTFVAERGTYKYRSFKINRPFRVNMLLPVSPAGDQGQGDSADKELWQVCLLEARAQELDNQEIARLWDEEPLQAKVRSQLIESGERLRCDELLLKYNTLLKSKVKVPITKTYTAFMIQTKRWEFNKLLDKKEVGGVQYLFESGKWVKKHEPA